MTDVGSNRQGKSVQARKMGRTEMGVRMQRGHFVPEFMVWLRKKGYAYSVDKALIKEYLSEEGAKNENIGR